MTSQSSTGEMDNLKSDDIANIVKNTKNPIVLKDFVKWPLLNWSLDDWLLNMNSKGYPFRCKPEKSSVKPSWERNCSVKNLTFKNFVEISQKNSKDWQYFDYKYMQQWFEADSEMYQQISWSSFGFPDRGAPESVLWVGSAGAHTPCHQDTYGINIVVQAFGSKRWLLFPPESGGMKPTRVPYEESSIYSQLDFSSPKKINDFQGISKCHMVDLIPGDALVVPSRWWHYVEHISPIGISINTWIPNESQDVESRVEEALTRLLVAQICKDLPQKRLPAILNPNEDDLPDLPLTVSILQVETTVSKCLEYRKKNSGAKRMKLSDDKVTDKKEVKNPSKSIDEIVNESDKIFYVNEISNTELQKLLVEKINTSKSLIRDRSGSETDGEDDGDSSGTDNITSAIINSFCQPNVIELIKDNLLNRFN